MQRYFFDIVNGGPTRDDIGTECLDNEAMRQAAIRALPDVAREEIPADGDHQFFTVVARDHRRQALYTATITFSGQWLKDKGT